MGMYDTYTPCEKLKEVVVKELGLTDFNWQTKSYASHLMYFGIKEDLRLVLEYNGCYTPAGKEPSDDDVQEMIKGTFTDVDSPFVDKGWLLLDFENSVLKSMLHVRNGEYFKGISETEPDILIDFTTLDNYKVSRITDFTNPNNDLILKRNDIIKRYYQ